MTGDRSVAVKLVGFVLGLLAVFAVGYGVGAATEPDAPAPAPGAVTSTTATTLASGMDMEHGS